MLDINVAIAGNIIRLMSRHHTSLLELADAIGVSEQVMLSILDGSRLATLTEIRKIADYYQLPVENLLKNTGNNEGTDVVRAFMGRVTTVAAREAIAIADELADMIVFHANVRENIKRIPQTWEI